MLILLALLLQAGTGQRTPDTATLERVRHNLERGASALDAPAPDLRVYRVEIVEREVVIERPWERRGVVPSYVRPPASIHHYEFLNAVTPEPFRSATVFPTGVPLMPAIGALKEVIHDGIRSYKVARAKRMVREDLERLRRACGGQLCPPTPPVR